ncbi:outer membrane beta-barrel protein [Pontibacter ramchanderi]|uniref:Outer membrane protein with beta-barrel domain n=1 Tax=Pontibacter ramchanderi TaxID=1179743 RepID=A0A2N3V0G0_9BACT|nr:outer membrane beta-barrel protein [Pontibacter ramchanderi]PKV75073.1 hypothetical protein BD749_0010 [Pontibacter ramchanderi]
MKTILTLFLLGLCTAAFAQKNFVPGYYITHEGEKVEVYLNDLNWNKNPTSIEVRKDANSSASQMLRVKDIKGFAVSSGDVFYSFVVDVDKSPKRLQYIELGAQPIITRDTVFLRALVKGNTSLYYLKDEHALEHFYIQKGEEVPVELINRIVKQMKGGKTGYATLPIYKGMLQAKLVDCPEVSEKADRIALKQSALKSIVESYNQCMDGTQSEYTAAEEKIKLNIFALGGILQHTLDIEGTSDDALNETDFKGLNYSIGTSFIATFPRGRGKFALLAEAMYKSYEVEGTYIKRYNNAGDIYTDTKTNFDMAYVGLNTMLRYRLIDTAIKPYISLGMGNNFMVSHESNQVILNYTSSSESRRERKPMADVRKHEQSLLLGFGVEVKRLSAELRLENGNGFSPYSGVASKNHTLGLQVGYLLK